MICASSCMHILASTLTGQLKLLSRFFCKAVQLCKVKRNMASLVEAHESFLIKALGDIATERFTCGGALQDSPKVYLNYLDQAGVWTGAIFPGLEEPGFQRLLQASTIASFGQTNVTSKKNYRDACTLQPDKFLTSFQLCNFGILEEIRVLLAPDSFSIHAQLCNMNIYTSQTGCSSKADVDSPSQVEGRMFGSLIVCLPSQFTGGDLVVRRNGHEVVYNWSSPIDASAQHVQWAAFVSDVEHKVLPITEGYRVTLTFNLYYCNRISPSPAIDVSNTPFYKNLKSGLEHPHFLHGGGVLGFSCQHADNFEEFDRQDDPSVLLKGSDYILWFAAKSLCLQVDLKPVALPECGNRCIREKFGVEYEYDNEYLCNTALVYFDNCDHITWCQKLNANQPAIVVVRDYSENSVVYQAAAILVTIPPWAERSIKQVAANE